jgi:hypothetical protein
MRFPLASESGHAQAVQFGPRFGNVAGAVVDRLGAIHSGPHVSYLATPTQPPYDVVSACGLL